MSIISFAVHFANVSEGDENLVKFGRMVGA